MEYAINFFGLNIAVSGMSTYNAGLTTTGHNISNVKTKGYSRQTVEQSAEEAVSLRTSYGMLGAGVDATAILSSRDDYYDAKYRISNTTVGKYSTESFYLSSIEDCIYPKEDSGRKHYEFFRQLLFLFEIFDNLFYGSDDPCTGGRICGYAVLLCQRCGSEAAEYAGRCQYRD